MMSRALKEEECGRRSLERRLQERPRRPLPAHGRLRLELAQSIDRDLLDEVFRLGLFDEAANVVLVGSGCGS